MYVKKKEHKNRFKKKYLRVTQGAFTKYCEKTQIDNDTNLIEKTPAITNDLEDLINRKNIYEEKKLNEKIQKKEIAPWEVQQNSLHNVRQEIIDLVEAANIISRKKKNKNPKRLRNLSDDNNVSL